MGSELRERTLGIVGFGGIGRSVVNPEVFERSGFQAKWDRLRRT